MFYLDIDRSSRNPLRNQIYEQLLKRILSGDMLPGSKMPSSRQLHEKLNISRNIILEVYEQLIAEGYLEGHQGKGTWVSQNVILGSYSEHRLTEPVKSDIPEKQADLIRFTCGIPDLKKFPVKKWKRSIDYSWALADARLYAYPPINGLKELRNQIADYLLMTKGIRADPGRLIITSGTAESLHLLASHFRGDGDDILVEDPVVDFAATIFRQNGYRLHHVPVDDRGLDCSRLPSKSDARLVFVSPSHQFPLGVVLTAARRVALVDYAVKKGMYLIEDDYDSEFRYEGQPLRSLCLINPGCVIHAGTFSKNMIPSLRLGYLLVPENLYPSIIATKERLMMRTPAEPQTAMAHFMRSGAFVRHIASMKRLYRDKYFRLTGALRDAFGGAMRVNNNAAGLHVHVAHSHHDFSENECAGLEEFGVEIDCEAMYSSDKRPGGLVLGFGNLSCDKIAEGVARLKRGVDAMSI